MILKDNFWKQRRTLNSFCGKVAKFRSTLHFMGEFNSNTNILMLMQPTFEEKIPKVYIRLWQWHKIFRPWWSRMEKTQVFSPLFIRGKFLFSFELWK